MATTENEVASQIDGARSVDVEGRQATESKQKEGQTSDDSHPQSHTGTDSTSIDSHHTSKDRESDTVHPLVSETNEQGSSATKNVLREQKVKDLVSLHDRKSKLEDQLAKDNIDVKLAEDAFKEAETTLKLAVRRKRQHEEEKEENTVEFHRHRRKLSEGDLAETYRMIGFEQGKKEGRKESMKELERSG
ncbi:hypothetical protein K491DRAFT_720114 [Lophiostoma macrostomum CBS 122681]|uniref:Uncharacterized protein n=1 Tax=Lophiostoma macrostomum CBS 122681 TaxID=1314788 RepID=A0A6A6SUC3_9PLEO|nr:hypothetical protein K491DRAFT_720114 [Lophiostoma macrostomum CBS 122681]